MAIILNRVSAWAVGALCVPAAIAAGTTADTTPNASGALPGDDALTCEQIYAQGRAESQRDQQARNQRNEQMKRQSLGTAALLTGAVAAGGLGGTGLAAQRAVEAQTDRQMSELSAPQATNPRFDHLKQLWARKHCVKK